MTSAVTSHRRSESDVALLESGAARGERVTHSEPREPVGGARSPGAAGRATLPHVRTSLGVSPLKQLTRHMQDAATSHADAATSPADVNKVPQVVVDREDSGKGSSSLCGTPPLAIAEDFDELEIEIDGGSPTEEGYGGDLLKPRPKSDSATASASRHRLSVFNRQLSRSLDRGLDHYDLDQYETHDIDDYYFPPAADPLRDIRDPLKDFVNMTDSGLSKKSYLDHHLSRSLEYYLDNYENVEDFVSAIFPDDVADVWVLDDLPVVSVVETDDEVVRRGAPPTPPPRKPQVAAKLVRDSPYLIAGLEKYGKSSSSDLLDEMAAAQNPANYTADGVFTRRPAGAYSSFRTAKIFQNNNKGVERKKSKGGPSKRSKPLHDSLSPPPAFKDTSRVNDPDSKENVAPGRPQFTRQRSRSVPDELAEAGLSLLNETGLYGHPAEHLGALIASQQGAKGHDMGGLLTWLAYSSDPKAYKLSPRLCRREKTLKAVKHITDKFNTMKRERQRAAYFQDGGRYSVSDDPTSPAPEIDGPARIGRTQEVTAQDILRVDMFYRSQATEVHVARCFADLRFATPQKSRDDLSNWEAVQCVGIPLLILNTGEGPRPRALEIALADKDTGFTLWFDQLDYLSAYRALTPSVHVMQLSTNLCRIACLIFHAKDRAMEFLETYMSITRDSDDPLWKRGEVSARSSRKFSFFQVLKKKRRTKADISGPCAVMHMTHKTNKVEEKPQTSEMLRGSVVSETNSQFDRFILSLTTPQVVEVEEEGRAIERGEAVQGLKDFVAEL